MILFPFFLIFTVTFFPERVARVPVSLWGSGVEVSSLDVVQPFATVRNRPQPSATVRTRPRYCHMAVPIGSFPGFPGVVIFGHFTCRVASFRAAGVALRDMWTCLMTCSKSFCMAGAILVPRFQNMRCIFRGRRSTLDVSSVIFRGRCSTSDVSRKSHWHGCEK